MTKRLTLAISVLFFFCLGGAAQAESLFEQCQQKKRDIAEMEDQAKQIDGEMADLDMQIRDLARKKQELLREKANKSREKKRLERKIRVDRAMMNRSCSGLRQCEAYERKIDQLKERIRPLSERLRRIRQEIRERGSEVRQLERETRKIESSYSKLNCDGLVAGQSSQSTIDRCSDLFSDWNRMQKDINSLQSSMSALRNRYRSVMRKMRRHNTELARLLRKMRASCGHSDRLADLRRMKEEQDDFRGIDDELDDMESSVRKIRTLKIVKPKLKKALKKKPVLRPVKDKRKKRRRRPTLKKVD